MLDTIQDKIKEAVYSEIKNAAYASSLQFIDRMCTDLKEKIPGFSPDSLVVKLAEIAEREAGRQAARAIEFKQELWNTIEQEIASQKHVEMAA